MDHRCLYGHRVPASFTFAVERRICPTCGAGTVTLEGYQLARRLAAEVPLQAVDAFNTVLFLQRSYSMTPKVAGEEAESVGEVLDVESGALDAAVEAPEPPASPKVRPAGAREEIPDHPSLKPHEHDELIAAGEADDDDEGDDVSAEELAFFNI